MSSQPQTPQDPGATSQFEGVLDDFNFPAPLEREPEAVPFCYCNHPAVKRITKKEGPNFGRAFFVCPLPQSSGRCDFFCWYEYMQASMQGQDQWTKKQISKFGQLVKQLQQVSASMENFGLQQELMYTNKLQTTKSAAYAGKKQKLIRSQLPAKPPKAKKQKQEDEGEDLE